jgi:hypothetical protein
MTIIPQLTSLGSFFIPSPEYGRDVAYSVIAFLQGFFQGQDIQPWSHDTLEIKDGPKWNVLSSVVPIVTPAVFELHGTPAGIGIDDVTYVLDAGSQMINLKCTISARTAGAFIFRVAYHVSAMGALYKPAPP